MPPCVKCDETKAAVRGQKVVAPAVYKNIAELNEIRTAHGERGLHLGQTNHKRNRDGSAVSHGVSACC